MRTSVLPARAGIVLVIASIVRIAFGAEPAGYPWPALPDAATITSGMKLGGDRGLVVLERRCSLGLRAAGLDASGVTRDEYVRMLITSDEGVRGAKVSINDRKGAEIQVLEGRTVGADGAVTPVDDARDITRIKVTRARSAVAAVDLATVSFPAPKIGSILDLHFKTTTYVRLFDDFRSLLFDQLSALSTDFDVTLATGTTSLSWSVMTIGETRGRAETTYKGPGHILIHMGSYERPAFEPWSVPSIHWEPLFLCFIDFSTLKDKGAAEKGSHNKGAIDSDDRGCITSVEFPTDRSKEYWRSVLNSYDKLKEKFLKDPGAAKKLPLETIAPPGLPVEDRVGRIYTYIQDHLTYNPDAEDRSTLDAMLDDGMVGAWQATFYLLYLLNRAGIPAQMGIVINRWGLRFSPLTLNEYLYDSNLVVKVDLAGGKPLYLMAGYPSMAMGSLPESYQDALVLLASGATDVATGFTRSNKTGSDFTTTAHALELDANGDVTGTLTLKEWGAPALEFALWNRYREFRKGHPKEDEDETEATEAARREREAAVERVVRDEIELPGNKLQLDAMKVEGYPIVKAGPVLIGSHVMGKGIGQQVQDQWLVYVHPAMAGWTNPFSMPDRKKAVWYDKGGHFVYEGEMKLPSGAIVMELPPLQTFEGPAGCKVRSSVEKIEKDGGIYLKSRLDFDRPYIVSKADYSAWMAYETNLAKASQQRCIITLPAKPELE